MAVELTASAAQTVAAGQNVLFTDAPVKCGRGYVVHRLDSRGDRQHPTPHHRFPCSPGQGTPRVIPPCRPPRGRAIMTGPIITTTATVLSRDAGPGAAA